MAADNRWLRLTLRGTIVAWMAGAVLWLVAESVERVFYDGPSGYGDSSVYSAIQFLDTTGQTYPDPMAPSSYGYIRAYGPDLPPISVPAVIRI